MIFRGVRAEPLINEYSWIKIHYETEPENIQEKINEFGKKRQK